MSTGAPKGLLHFDVLEAEAAGRTADADVGRAAERLPYRYGLTVRGDDHVLAVLRDAERHGLVERHLPEREALLFLCIAVADEDLKSAAVLLDRGHLDRDEILPARQPDGRRGTQVASSTSLERLPIARNRRRGGQMICIHR